MANPIILKTATVAGATVPSTNLAYGELAYFENTTEVNGVDLGGELYIGLLGGATKALIAAEDSAKLTGAQTFNGTLMLTPAQQTTGTDAITVLQAQTLLAVNSEAKNSVYAATTAALPANTGTAGVLTAVAPGVLYVDDLEITAIGQRILVKNEVDLSNNGIYVVTTVGTAGAAYVMARAPDANTSSEVKRGMNCWVDDGGTVNARSQWIMNAADPVLNTDDITFVKVSGLGGLSANNGLEITTGNVIQVATNGVTENELAATFVDAAGAILGGGGVELSLAVDGILTVDGTSVRITNDSVTAQYVAAAVCGDGISGGGGTALKVDAGVGLTVADHTVSIDYAQVLEGNSAIDAGTWA